MRVTAGREYFYFPNRLDVLDARTTLVPGSLVRVVNLPGCPRANTMQHAHVEFRGSFAGLVHTNSLHSLKDARCECGSAMIVNSCIYHNRDCRYAEHNPVEAVRG
jgi:hypothetical protein